MSESETHFSFLFGGKFCYIERSFQVAETMSIGSGSDPSGPSRAIVPGGFFTPALLDV